MSILAVLPALVFGLAGLTALAVLAVSARRFVTVWGEAGRALENCGEVRIARVTLIDTGVPGRPRLRLVEGGISRPVAVSRHGLRAAA